MLPYSIIMDMSVEIRPNTVNQEAIINLGGWALNSLNFCFKRYENGGILTLVDFDNLYPSIHDYERRFRESEGLYLSPLTTASMLNNRVKVYHGDLGNSDRQWKRNRDYKKFGWLFDKFENLPLFTKDYARYQPTPYEKIMFKFKTSEDLAKRSYKLFQFYSEIAINEHGFSCSKPFFEDLRIADYLLARSRKLYSYFENLWMEVEFEKRKKERKEEVVISINKDKIQFKTLIAQSCEMANNGWLRFASQTDNLLHQNIANVAAQDYSELIKIYL